jgi:hypothetical protein
VITLEIRPANMLPLRVISSDFIKGVNLMGLYSIALRLLILDVL